MQHALEQAPAGYNPIKFKYGPYSASRLIVARCPSRFYSKYVIKDKIVSDSIASAKGSAIHEVLQKITESRVKKEEITPKQLDEWVSKAVGKHPASYEQVGLISEAARAYVATPCPYVRDNTICEATLAVKVFEEESFAEDTVLSVAYTKLPYAADDSGYRINPEAYFGVKIDQLTVDEEIKTVTILDHKSTPSANANADHDFQMSCYAWLTSLYYPGYSIRSVFHYAHPSLKFYAPPVYWSAEDLADAEMEIRCRVQAIESFEDYPALPGSHCDYCHMVQQCPELRTIQEQNARGDINMNVHTIDDMKRVAQQLRVTGVLYDQLNKKLKEAIETNCPESGIAIEGMWYGFKVSDEKVDWQATERKLREESARVPAGGPGDLNDVLKKSGLNPEVFREWRGDKLKALWKLDKTDLINTLKPYIVTDRSTRFGGYKI